MRAVGVAATDSASAALASALIAAFLLRWLSVDMRAICLPPACPPPACCKLCLHVCLPAGVDGIVMFWDLRQSGAPSGQAAPALDLARLCDTSVPHISQKQHGITSLALHPQGKGRQPACYMWAGACLGSGTCPTIQRSLHARTLTTNLCVQAASCL